MKDKCFIDTNILIYLYSIDEIRKREIAEQLVNYDKQAIVSTQVINEFINVMQKKKKLSSSSIEGAILELSSCLTIELINLSTINLALDIMNKYSYSYFDSLILSSALENKCAIIYTEDLQGNQLIEKKLRIINPF